MAAVEGILGELAVTYLVPTTLHLGGRGSRRKIMNAVAASEDWIDTLSGERLLAYGDETVMGKGDDFVVLTDRRLLARRGTEVTCVPFAGVLGARHEQVALRHKLLIDTAQGRGVVQGVRVSPLNGGDLAHVRARGDASPRQRHWLRGVRAARRAAALGAVKPGMFVGVLEALADAEPVVLRGRIVWGWQGARGGASRDPSAGIHAPARRDPRLGGSHAVLRQSIVRATVRHRTVPRRPLGSLA